MTVIGKGAMKGNTDLKKVTVSEGITTIGKGAFAGDTSLKSIVLPSTITKISKNAFKDIAENATFTITGTMKDIRRIRKQLKKSGVDLSKVIIKYIVIEDEEAEK